MCQSCCKPWVQNSAQLAECPDSDSDSLGRQVQQPGAGRSELPHGMRQPKLGARRVWQGLDGGVGLAVGLQQVQQHLPCQAEVEHLAWREVAGDVATCGQSLHPKRVVDVGKISRHGYLLVSPGGEELSVICAACLTDPDDGRRAGIGEQVAMWVIIVVAACSVLGVS